MAATMQGSLSLEYTTPNPIIFTALPAASVPEPATAAPLAIGLLGQGYAVRRRRPIQGLQGSSALLSEAGASAGRVGPFRRDGTA